MNRQISGSFAEFNPIEVMERIDVHLTRIDIARKDAKENWLKERRQEGRIVGPFFRKKRIEWTEEELEDYWMKGDSDDLFSYWDTAKYSLWDRWDNTIAKFQRIRNFCQLAIDAGNKTVYLSREDALFAINWET